jgi:hypothetical protein
MRNIVFIISGTLLILGAILFISRWIYAPYLFAFGSSGVTLFFLTAPYKDLGFRRRRLHRISILAGLFTVAASYFMFRQHTGWVVFLLIAALLLLYTSSVKIKEGE